jgi:hypothetical protein
MTREPVLGPGALPFLVFAAALIAVRFWLVPMAYPEPEVEFRHLTECSATPPPQGVVYICQSSAIP